ncbi:AAA family ATPase [Vagococcus bubulae]|uniref:AAA family ATPase n=1 Tax=Vagococcus bubulae TaxID=1977868 RepID=UPI0022E3A2A6|nr:AAA family ATPase [Vagococcus bubulae]
MTKGTLSLGKSFTEKELVIKGYILDKQNKELGTQGSYNIPKSFFDECNKKNVFIDIKNLPNFKQEDIDPKRQLDKFYILDSSYKLELSDNIISILGIPKNVSRNILIVSGPNSKLQIRKTHSDKLSKLPPNNDDFSWFSKLYKEAPIPGEIIFTLDNNLKKLIIDYQYVDLKKVEINDLSVNEEEEEDNINKPHQLIFSGAPGTGKSYTLNKWANNYFKDSNNSYYDRVTFHPNMTYGQFVGVFKPFPSNDKESPITYKFVPGVLLKQLEKAYKNPDKNYLILIEEINRANVASVFGDVFQLLDRKDGVSEYPISIPEDILLRFYDKEKGILSNDNIINNEIKEKLKNEGLFFPKNLYIWASMNGADQGVMPMDTAFKRRWEFEKFDVNDLGEDGTTFFEDKFIKYNQGAISWNELRKALNSRMLKLKIPEDKLMGPYFLSRETLEDTDKLTKSFESKVLMYLFDDATKMKRKDFFNLDDKDMYYSSLVRTFRELGPNVFNEISVDDISIDFRDESQDQLESTLRNLPFMIDPSMSDERKRLLEHLENKISELNYTFMYGQVSNGVYIRRKQDMKRQKFLFIDFSGKSNDSISIRLPIEYKKTMPNFSQNLNTNKDSFKSRFIINSIEQIDEVMPYINEALNSRIQSFNNKWEN